MKNAVLLTVLIVLIGLTTLQWPPGCSAPTSDLPTVQMPIGTSVFTLEIADTYVTRQRGLMFRDSMPSRHGMLFVFNDDEPRSFWMKNTRIPLDIVYLDASGRIVSIHQMKPYDLSSTRSKGSARYAIELNVGTAASLGLKEGEQLAIPSQILSKKVE